MVDSALQRRLVAILAADVVGFSRLAGADEDRTLARLRALRSDLIDPTIAIHNGRVVKRTGDGVIIEFRSVVDAVRCAVEIQSAMIERNAGVAPERRIEFRIGIHIGDVVEESDGDLMGNGINIASRLEGIAEPGSICLSEDAYRQVKTRLDHTVSDLGETKLKNISEPIRVYSLLLGGAPIRSYQHASATAQAVRRPGSRYIFFAAAIVAAAIISVGYWTAAKYKSDAPVQLASAQDAPLADAAEESQAPAKIDNSSIEASIPNGVIYFPFAGKITDWEFFLKFTTDCENEYFAALTSPTGRKLIVMDRGLRRCTGTPSTYSSVTTDDVGVFVGTDAQGEWEFAMSDLDQNQYSGTLDEVWINLTVDDGGTISEHKVSLDGLPIAIPN